MSKSSRSLHIYAALVSISLVLPSTIRSETEWAVTTPSSQSKSSQPKQQWEHLQESNTPSAYQVWEVLGPDQEYLPPESMVWSELITPPTNQESEPTNNQRESHKVDITKGLHWPNGQLMSEEDQIHFRTAYSRGSMIQIGDTLYPNLGFNALQRHPKSWGNIALVGIDDSRVTGIDCQTGDFLDKCADAILEARFRLWNSNLLSLDLHWTMHSLSGEGAPFNFSVGDQNFGNDDTGTKFGDGQSLGFVASKNFGKTFGVSLAGYRIIHFDETTDLPRNFALFGTKIFRLNDTLSPPIISLSLGLMTDVFNSETNFGTVSYPKSLRGGLFPSTFADIYDKENSGYEYYPDVAGVSSAFVCADRSIFKGKSLYSVDPKCIQEVYLGPIASIGFAPWPWFGIYGKYSGTDIDLGISLKPFKEIPWTFSIEAITAIKGVNPTLDQSFQFRECRGKDDSTFSDCRTRVGIYTEFSF